MLGKWAAVALCSPQTPCQLGRLGRSRVTTSLSFLPRPALCPGSPVRPVHLLQPLGALWATQGRVHESKKCLLIDDEADFCSIGYEMNKDTENFDLRTIASQINDLRLELTCRFIQVTATPYSLYLQPETINLGGDKDIKPVQPATTILVPYGDAYIGGDYYFDKEVNPLNDYLFHAIDDLELEIIKNSDRRRFKEEDIFSQRPVQHWPEHSRPLQSRP